MSERSERTRISEADREIHSPPGGQRRYEEWQPGVVMQAACNSQEPRRETVRQVSVVRFRVLSDELTSGLLEIRFDR